MGRSAWMAARLLRWLLSAVGLLAVAAGSIALALRVTPLQQVSALGQTVEVGTAAPTFSLSGPGVLDLFGQSIDTKLTFTGPVRPRLVLTKITIDQQVANFVGPGGRRPSGTDLGTKLAAGWKRYFEWEVAIAGIAALVISAAYVGIRRRPLGRSLLVIAASLVVAEGCNLGAIMLTAYSAPRLLSSVHSLNELVGRSYQTPLPAAPGPEKRGVQAVVIGDSTAAGLGNPLVAHPSPLDRACGRSRDSYAADLAKVNAWQVENLACSGATIPAGLLGSQHLGRLTAHAQLAEAKRVVGARVIFVSVGADDLQWDVMVRLCALLPSCRDAASTAYFQSELHTFTKDYYQLLAQLTALPQHPDVIINQYYDPFDPHLTCLDHLGLGGDKQRVLLQRLDALNTVLAKGAEASGFLSVKPDFSGHTLCSAQPYVQGLHGKAPFHPTVSGQLAIALADEQALHQGSSGG